MVKLNFTIKIKNLKDIKINLKLDFFLYGINFIPDIPCRLCRNFQRSNDPAGCDAPQGGTVYHRQVFFGVSLLRFRRYLRWPVN